MEGFARWMTDGGIWMYFILAVGILALLFSGHSTSPSLSGFASSML